MINKGFILKTAAVVSCVVVLGVTGCRGGVNEAAAVKNKSNVISIEIKEAKGASNDISERDREETVEAVVGSNGHEGRITQAEDNDTERNEMENRRGQEVTGEAEPSEDGDSVLTEEDGSDVGRDTGTEDAAYDDEGDSASAVYSEPDMGDDEYTDDADEWYEPDTARVEAEEGQADEPYESESYDDSNEQYGDSEYSKDTDYGWSDGAGDNGEWVYYTTALITFYDSGACCCGEYASGYTASGEPAIVGWTCANGALPFGTMVLIDGQEYCVTDRGVGADAFDILVGSHDEALARGMYYTDVYIRG